MTKIELIKILEEYPDNTEIFISPAGHGDEVWEIFGHIKGVYWDDCIFYKGTPIDDTCMDQNEFNRFINEPYSLFLTF